MNQNRGTPVQDYNLTTFCTHHGFYTATFVGEHYAWNRIIVIINC